MTVPVDASTETTLVITVSDIEVYDHVRPTDADVPEGIYRVVGAGERVTLLRVGNADGRRVTTGEVHAVDRDILADFEATENPDENRSLAATIARIPQTIYWQLYAFAISLAATPLYTAAFVAMLLAGSVGPRILGTTGPLFSGLVFAGALGLAFVGSGRL